MSAETLQEKPTREEMNRLSWHSRRGMLELDVLLIPFTQEVYPSLSSEQRVSYTALLACEDADLFVWFMRQEIPQDEHLANMVTMIIERARSQPPIH